MSGLHHVTGIASSATEVLRFYSCVLGLRLVKRTVTRADPGSYHLYFGDRCGRPGSLISVFSWEGVSPGRFGKGEAERTDLRAAPGSLHWWADRLERDDIPSELSVTAFDERRLSFRDPDGLLLGILERNSAVLPDAPHDRDIPEAYSVAGLDGVTLAVENNDAVSSILTGVLGWTQVDRVGPQTRLRAHPGIGGEMTLREVGRSARGRLGRGTISHVAFRAACRSELDSLANKLRNQFGLKVSGLVDKVYYTSVFFREPGGLLFEIATDSPGFTVDEKLEELGTKLMLPEHLEGRRPELETILPTLTPEISS